MGPILFPAKIVDASGDDLTHFEEEQELAISLFLTSVAAGGLFVTTRLTALRPRLLFRGSQPQRILGHVVRVLTACSWYLPSLWTSNQMSKHYLLMGKLTREAETI